MAEKLKVLVQAIREAGSMAFTGGRAFLADMRLRMRGHRRPLFMLSVMGLLGYGLVSQPPLKTVGRSEVGVRLNRLTGGSSQFGEGSVLVVPGLHELRRFSLRDQLYRPVDSSRSGGSAPFQSNEGLSIGVDLSIRYALDPAWINRMAGNLPEDIGKEVVEPAVQGVIYKTLTHYSVREIFSTRRNEIRQTIETELRTALAADGIRLRNVQMGNVDLPPEYKAGMESLLAEELQSEKMKYTLELKDKQVRERALEAEAMKVQREKQAEAAANEQIIAAKAQEEAMKHVLPFKQKQIEQRQFEAEADKISRVKAAEASAQARVIEATSEASSRQKLADAEVYRLEQIGKVTSEQMARDGELISKHPLLIQKTMADKLSDKISVIIAPPSANGFIGASLIGSVGARSNGSNNGGNSIDNMNNSEGGQE